MDPRCLLPFCLSALLSAAGAAPPDRAEPGAPVPVVIEFFYEPGCRECEWVKQTILPAVEDLYAGFYALALLDVGVESNYVRLAACQERLNTQVNAPVYILVGEDCLLSGVDEIRDRLFTELDAAIADSLHTPSGPSSGTPSVDGAEDAGLLRRKLHRFTLAEVLVGGLIDGINPCAFATLVFLISFLSVMRVQGRALLWAGVAFCLASFLTYGAIGFGLLHAIQALSAFHTARRAVDALLLGVLALLALLSFRDAIRYAGSGDARDVRLQLPHAVKQRIHTVVRAGLGGRTRIASAFLVGAAVTALESVCTGQVYVPTLVLVARTGRDVRRSLGYLAAYNLMFIMPLVVVFVLTYQGLKLMDLIAWSRRNVVLSKILMGLFFLALAGALIWLWGHTV